MIKGFSIQINSSENTFNSFLQNNYDDFYLQTENFDFLFEGVLLNKKKLLKEFALKDFETFIREKYRNQKEQIINLFEGEYRGFIVDKIQNKIFIFTNITSTQRVFYGKFKDTIFIDSSLIRLNENLKKSGVISEPDEESLYQLLCFGNLPEDKTPIYKVKKLLDGCFLEIDLNTLELTEKQYFSLADISRSTLNKEKSIDKVHEIFTESIVLEYEKDAELNTNHLAFLSGGLDSRVAMLYAIKNGYKPDNALCFSQSNYFDHTISKKIAEDFNIHYEFIPLDEGRFLNKIDELIEISEGMSFFTGAIHVQHALENMQYENFALFHGGAIGDGVLGAFNSEPKRKKPTGYKFIGNDFFLPKVQNSLDKMIDDYETEELFLIRNIAFNRTVIGAHVLEKKAYQTSPFMTKDFLKFAISIPEEWKYKHQFYVEWINKHCLEATKYRWERTLMKPNAAWKTTFGDQVVKRGFNILNNKIFKMPQAASMYPYQYYFEKNSNLQNIYQTYFEDNIGRIEAFPELQQDLITLFSSKKFHYKCQSINILGIFKLYFSK
ncbi:asparagine synthetase B family protein [Frigoriflavimonas asaccharolytica]|uniref:asparagine synthase (glutamine-hydrolyzing) n=1 Tax=Frigoriflavimonas asaccharolytica TaxID=2735899 RepID=A0A8J8G6T7_9FLAO|nr:hypothetical protein [Frigoriflavimonas asaccharolytica]NRS92228.1 asparagine synthetase B (glutamine-hydrolysing) [Frigoriflavimonas asaccharolytica]